MDILDRLAELDKCIIMYRNAREAEPEKYNTPAWQALHRAWQNEVVALEAKAYYATV